MARLASLRVAFVACAALVVVALIWAAIASADHSSPLSVSAGGDGSGPRDRSGYGQSGSTTATSEDLSAVEQTTTKLTTTRSGSTRPATTTTTGRSSDAPRTTTTVAPAKLTPPPAPDNDHITFWGQVIDEVGRPVKGACLRVVKAIPVVPNTTIVRTQADGTYVLTMSHLDDDPMPYDMDVDSCAGDRLDLLGVVAPLRPGEWTHRSARGELLRTDLVMPLAPTIIDVAVVDPSGRPILGVCIGWWDSWEQISKRAPVDDRGHAQIDRPGARNTAIHLVGVCDSPLGYSASTTHVQAQLDPGPSSIRVTVPWSAGDDQAQPVYLGLWSDHFDLVSLSTQPGELDPSCVGAFTRSRWYQMDSGPFPGFPSGGQLGGPIAGHHIATSLQRGGTFVVWGLDSGGRVTEIGCAPAGTSISLPVGVYFSVRIQVIPTGDLAQVGSFVWEF